MTTKQLAKTAMIAAVYTVVSLVIAPLAYGPVQVRISEALTVLPLIYRPAIPGLTLGCCLTNIIGAMTGANPAGYIDAVVGSLATFIAAVLTWKLRDHKIKDVPVLSLAQPVFWNFLFVGAELGFMLFPGNVLVGSLICGLEVAVGELISVIVGWFLVKWLDRTGIFKEG